MWRCRLPGCWKERGGETGSSSSGSGSSREPELHGQGRRRPVLRGGLGGRTASLKSDFASPGSGRDHTLVAQNVRFRSEHRKPSVGIRPVPPPGCFAPIPAIHRARRRSRKLTFVRVGALRRVAPGQAATGPALLTELRQQGRTAQRTRSGGSTVRLRQNFEHRIDRKSLISTAMAAPSGPARTKRAHAKSSSISVRGSHARP